MDNVESPVAGEITIRQPQLDSPIFAFSGHLGLSATGVLSLGNSTGRGIVAQVMKAWLTARTACAVQTCMEPNLLESSQIRKWRRVLRSAPQRTVRRGA